MALFRPIAAPTDLPAMGTGRESGTFDFKGEVDVANQRELAKDVAAFANALGGVILVGAYEDKGTLGRYAPMAREDAEKVKTAYELAIGQRCHPQPVVDVVSIETADPLPPGHVVAVNVYATPLGPVGVRWDSDKKGPSFAFPLRTTAQTHFMTPTELAMLMVPEVRRIATLLDQIPPSQRTGIQLCLREPSPGTYVVTLVSVDPLSSTATFDATGPRTGETWRLDLPIDCISSVWRTNDGAWKLAITGGTVAGREFIPM